MISERSSDKVSHSNIFVLELCLLFLFVDSIAGVDAS